MFRLHDRTRRRLNLVVFLLVCVLPTVVLAGWGLWRWSGAYGRAEAHRLSQLLGLRVRFQSVRHLRPGAVRYERLELEDPATGQWVLRCGQLEAAWQRLPEASGNRGASVTLRASQVEAHAPELDQLWRVAHEVMARRHGLDRIRLQATVPVVRLVDAEGSDPLRRLLVRIAALPQQAEGELQFHWADRDASVHVRLVSTDGEGSPETTWEVTADGPVPCRWAGRWIPASASLGPESTFAGHFRATRRSGPWHGELAGRLEGVDLAHLGERYTAHQISGQAKITVDACRFSGQRLEMLSGSLRAGPGQISDSLVEAASRFLGLVRPTPPRPSALQLTYEQLAFRFCVDERGVRLWGQCQSPADGVVLTGPAGPLLGDCGGRPLPLASLVQACIPPAGPLVSATRRSAGILRWLPLPETAGGLGDTAVLTRP